MTDAAETSRPQWQLVLVLWGTKYGVDEVNHLIHTIRTQAAAPPRVVMITDRPRQGLADGVIQRPFPEFFLQPQFLRGGCQAKLAMFEAGLLPDDRPSVYVDIDTVVFGDLTRFLALQTTEQTVAILQSAVLPFGALARMIFQLTGGRRYARGNSSIIVFHPRHCGYIAERFRSLYTQHGEGGFRPTIADERFISWSAQPHMRAIPHDMAVKLPTEFMLPWPWLIYLRAAMPWVRRRWQRLVAITLPGVEVKGEELLALADGATITDRKGRKLIWSERAIGSAKERLTTYYSALLHK